MLYVLTMIDGHTEINGFDTLKEAEGFAADVAEEGHPCEILRLLRQVEAKEVPAGLDALAAYSGVRPGIDFPASM